MTTTDRRYDHRLGRYVETRPKAETPAEELARIRAKFPKWGSARVLEAMGHPGYGEDFAQAALAKVAAGGCSTHQAVYAR